MRRTLAMVTGSLLGVALLGVVGCASTMVAPATQHADAGITSVVEASLEANDDVMISSKVKSKLIGNSLIKATDIDVSSSQGVVTPIGRVGTQTIKTDAARAARATKGVTDVNNEFLVGNGR